MNGPKIVSATQTSSNAFEIRFDESVTRESAQSLSNYVVRAVGAVQSLTVTQVWWGQFFVRVRMDTNFDLDADHTVCVSGLRDQRGNERTNDCAEIVRLMQNGLTAQKWRFNDTIRDNAYADGAWTYADFDDSAWGLATGLFWEDVDAPVTCSTPATRLQKGRAQYYRRNFMGPSSKAVDATLTLHYVLDDGAVFHVNGREIARHGMPPGTVRYETNPLETAAEPPVCITIATNIPASWLNPGTNNVVAIEVHQAETNPDAFGADMAFDGVLSVTYKEHRLPAMRISRPSPNNVRVTWIGNGWRFERSTGPDGAWEVASPVTTVQGTNVFTEAVSGMRFYRLRNP